MTRRGFPCFYPMVNSACKMYCPLETQEGGSGGEGKGTVKFVCSGQDQNVAVKTEYLTICPLFASANVAMYLQQICSVI